MLIVLPNSCTGLSALQTALTTFDLASFDDDMGERTVHVTMPKFKTKSSFNLNAPLSNVRFLLRRDRELVK